MSRKSENKARQGKATAARPTDMTPPGQVKPDAGRSFSQDWLLALLLVAFTFLTYQQVWRADFIWDDDAHVTGPELRSLHGLWRIWSEPGATQQYYPVLHSAFWVEHRLWGDSPLGYHLANVLLHAAVACLLYRVLRRLAVPGAFLAAAVFAVHPVCVESVAWISEQKNTLSCLFYLAAALTYFRYDAERRTGWYALATGLFGLALASKSVTATLPAALLVVLWWKRGRLSWKGDVLPLSPWFAMAAAAGIVTVWVEKTLIGARGAAFGLGLPDRFLVAGRAVWFYLGKLIAPADLTFIYPRWVVDDRAAWQYLFPIAAIIALTALFALRKRTRGPLAAALLFTGTLFPALGFINVYPFIFSYVADHFQYLAAAMMIAAAAAGFTLAADRLPPAGRIAAWMASLGVVALLAGLTWSQCAMYADAETLWQTTLARNPACWMACDNLGNILLKQGKVDQAVAQFERALVINPEDHNAHNNLGTVLLHAGQMEQAVIHFQNALRISPGNAEAHNNLGLALLQKRQPNQAVAEFQQALALKEPYAAAQFNLGNAWLQAGQAGRAQAHFQRAVALEPANAEMHDRLATALLINGQTDAAVAQYKKALAIREDFAEAHFNLGNAFLQGGQMDQAVAQYRRSLEIDPVSPRARVNLAHALLQEGQDDEAVAQFRKALAIEPNDVETNNDLGAVLLGKGQVDEAVAQFQKAVAIKDDYAEAHFNLGNVFLQKGALDQAMAHYQKTLASEPNNARAHNNLGLALLQADRVDEAVTQFQKALAIDPNYAQARRNLGLALATRK
jgi:tetratricopeptide (TPR) repeat protein